MKYLAEEIGAERDTPLRGYYHENWKREEAPLLDELGAVVDKRDDSNPRTACWRCNTRRRADEGERIGSDIANWDGMSGVFVFLAKQKRYEGRLTAYERELLKALESGHRSVLPQS
jgi:hypothetical protein